MHVDLMRRASEHVICQPGAVPGDEFAARRATQPLRLARALRDWIAGGRRMLARRHRQSVKEEDEFGGD
jgi:hypothetical protein